MKNKALKPCKKLLRVSCPLKIAKSLWMCFLFLFWGCWCVMTSEGEELGKFVIPPPDTCVGKVDMHWFFIMSLGVKKFTPGSGIEGRSWAGPPPTGSKRSQFPPPVEPERKKIDFFVSEGAHHHHWWNHPREKDEKRFSVIFWEIFHVSRPGVLCFG